MTKPMTRTERALGWLSCRVLVALHKRALRRRDFHEANHCMAAIIAGNGSHHADRWPCPLPASAHHAPGVWRATFEPGDPR